MESQSSDANSQYYSFTGQMISPIDPHASKSLSTSTSPNGKKDGHQEATV